MGNCCEKSPRITRINTNYLIFFSCNSWAFFMAVPHDAAPSPGDERKPTQPVCAAYRVPSPRGAQHIGPPCHIPKHVKVLLNPIFEIKSSVYGKILPYPKKAHKLHRLTQIKKE